MKLENIAKGNLLDLAINSSDSSVLTQLAADINMNVRRAVARNRFTSSQILERLISDPVLNVSFMAAQNPNCTSKRIFTDTSHPCVQCSKDERQINCDSCGLANSYRKLAS